jgi:CHAD domain-containing protein
LDPLSALTAILRLWKDKLTKKKVPGFAQGLEFSYHKARKLAFQAESSDDDNTYHRCRKWTKYYHYQLQMLVPEPRAKAKAQIKQLKLLGEILGGFHDRCVLEYSINDLLQQKPLNESLEQAALLMLSWLVEQKRKDKAQCQALFESVFARPHNPVNLKA